MAFLLDTSILVRLANANDGQFSSNSGMWLPDAPAREHEPPRDSKLHLEFAPTGLQQISPGQSRAERSGAVRRAAPPWVARIAISQALKGRHNGCALSGLGGRGHPNPGRRCAEYRSALPWAGLLPHRWCSMQMPTCRIFAGQTCNAIVNRSNFSSKSPFVG